MRPRPPASGGDPGDREALRAKYTRVRRFTEHLCEPLAVEDYCPQVAVEASPPRWHLAHVSWFFETFLLCPYLPGYRVFHEGFAYLFNSYYEQTGGGSGRGPSVVSCPAPRWRRSTTTAATWTGESRT